MPKFESKICSFITAIAVLFFVLPTSIANAQTNTLSDAILKTNRATSMQSNGKLNLTLKAEGLSEQDQQDFGWVSEILNNLQVAYNTKVSGNSNGTISRHYAKISANVGGSPYSGELWSDINLTGKTPIVKGIVKSPQLFEMMLGSEYMNKYMLLDFEQIKKTPEIQTELGKMDFGKMISENKELQNTILTIFEKYSSQLDLNYSLISNKENEYKIKIDDSEFKDIIKKAVNLTAKNKEIQNLISNLIITEMKNSGANAQEISATKVDMNQMFTTLESKEFLNEFNKMMDKLKDVNILGNKGIDITYKIDKNGYITSTKGVIEIVANMNKLGKIFGESVTEGIPTGIYTAGINFEVNNSNINGKVNIVMPKLTSSNSFNIANLLNGTNPQPIKVITSAIKNGSVLKTSEKVVKPVVVKHTLRGGQLPKTSSNLYDLLLIGVVLTLIGALGLKNRKKYE
ncbi:LPXTG cell wall anchor domain-containing protein [Clostridium psychrophilum]|uniref:LPXTG cell wall anchor domain-containing protein n=1 Tax=Clostridium psychrophilum TaxID=132926 RepID=UPI001C0B2B5B|nr:LPXTG cell wall anchor domain-containing protein [Clostridium psychrophilum]MBU3181232.1 LPXTG cell wall anchor domain-containing protein [Clostridium psychrophilum]